MPPATPVAVVTDSTHYIPREMVVERGINVVSLYVNQGGQLTKESDMPDFEAFYDGLRTAAELPTTSQPSIGDFIEVYEPLVAAGHDIVSIHLSGALSGTVESARQAAAELGAQRRIEIVDSLSCAGGLAMVVLAAQSAADSGAGVEQVADRAREALEAMEIWFSVDTLEYFQRGGRIGRAQAWIGGALSVKPILSFSEGTLHPIERVRTRRRSIERMLDYLRARHADGATAWLVQHIQSPDVAEKLVEGGREIFGTDPILVSEVGPVLGTYAGPGMLGVGGIPPNLLT
jgi:DegV family protein with EDD domain